MLRIAVPKRLGDEHSVSIGKAAVKDSEVHPLVPGEIAHRARATLSDRPIERLAEPVPACLALANTWRTRHAEAAPLRHRLTPRSRERPIADADLCRIRTQADANTQIPPQTRPTLAIAPVGKRAVRNAQIAGNRLKADAGKRAGGSDEAGKAVNARTIEGLRLYGKHLPQSHGGPPVEAGDGIASKIEAGSAQMRIILDEEDVHSGCSSRGGPDQRQRSR